MLSPPSDAAPLSLRRGRHVVLVLVLVLVLLCSAAAARRPPPVAPRRTLFVAPRGGVAQRLAAVASALALGAERGHGVAIVWPAGEEPWRWADLYAAPALPLVGAFPTGCRAMDAASPTALRAARWQRAGEGGGEALCVSAAGFLVDDPGATRPFFRSLRLAPRLAGEVAAFEAEWAWHEWGQWAGIIVAAGGGAAAVLDAAAALVDLPVDGDSLPRFFVAGDGEAAELAAELAALWRARGLHGGQGAVVSWPAPPAHAGAAGAARAEAAALHLLAAAPLLVVGGRAGATARAAALMGRTSFLVGGEAE